MNNIGRNSKFHLRSDRRHTAGATPPAASKTRTIITQVPGGGARGPFASSSSAWHACRTGVDGWVEAAGVEFAGVLNWPAAGDGSMSRGGVRGAAEGKFEVEWGVALGGSN